MFKKKGFIVLIFLLTISIYTALMLNPTPGLAFNWPWDQGHDSCDPKDPRWGTSAETCDPCCDCKKSPTFMKSGNFSKTFQDIVIPGTIPLEITRTYHTHDNHNGLFGYGWTSNIEMRIVRFTDYVLILIPDGRRLKYTLNPDGTYTPPTDVVDRLMRNPDGTYTLREKGGRRYLFDLDGNLGSIIDRNENQLDISYDNSCPLDIDDGNGRKIDFVKDPNGKITSITDPDGRRVLYDYDSNGNLISVTDPMGNVTRYTYNADHDLTGIIDSRGNNIYSITYDSQERVTRYTEGAETYYITYVSENETRKRDSQGNVWRYFFDEHGMINKEIDPLGNVIERLHNHITGTSLDWEKDANGNTTSYEYDTNGNMTKITDAMGKETLYTYDPNFNQILTETDANDVVTRYEYDTRGNNTKIIRDSGGPLQSGIAFTYNSNGNMTGRTDPLGNTTRYIYDTNGNITQIIDPLGQTTTFTYDNRGNRLSETDPLWNTTTYTYDLLDRLISVTDPTGNRVTYSYDNNGNQIAITDAGGNTYTNTYDSYNRLIKVTDPLGHITRYSYDSKGNRTQVVDANGNQTNYSYDALGRQIQTINALNYATGYTYDGAGIF